jgi:asparagine synthetase B (glutamine-hydrolysing)
MCGIAGLVNLDAPRPQRSVSHRGPDDKGTWRSADGTVALAH